MNRIFIFSALIIGLIAPCSGAVIQITPSGGIAISNTFEGIYLDFGGDLNTVTNSSGGSSEVIQNFSYVVSDIEPATYDINFFFGGLGIINNPATIDLVRTGVGEPIANLAFGSTVGVTSLFDPAESTSGGPIGDSFAHVGPDAVQFRPNEAGYIGFAWDPTDSGIYNYGYFEYIYNLSDSTGLITGWAFNETAGESITVAELATVIPESSTILTIAGGSVLIGLLGRARWRRQRSSSKD